MEGPNIYKRKTSTDLEGQRTLYGSGTCLSWGDQCLWINISVIDAIDIDNWVQGYQRYLGYVVIKN